MVVSLQQPRSIDNRSRHKTEATTFIPWRRRTREECCSTGLVTRLHRPCLFQCDSTLLPERQIAHVACDRRSIAQLDRGIGCLTSSHAFSPVGNMVMRRRISGDGRSARTVHRLRVVTNRLLRFAADHIICARHILDGAVAAQNALPQPVAAVAKSGLPGHHEIVREIDRDHDCVGHAGR